MMAQDVSLAPFSTWYSSKSIYCEGGQEEHEIDIVIDEPSTGATWNDVDVSKIKDFQLQVLKGNFQNHLPDNDVFPHCYMPMHIWLDKGLVSSRVKKHPMILRAAWLPHSIRNGSGNGGGVLLAYIPVVIYFPLPLFIPFIHLN